MKGRPTRTTSTPREHKISSSSSSTTNQTTAAIQFSMTPHETRLINDIVQYKDTSMQSLKHPKVQEIIKTRKGRWVKEEEEYANFLSQEFFMGLADIKEGTTKRSYLSNKLNCTKMRISKKFKGQNNGKEVFTRKTERPDNGGAYSLEEIHMHRQRHVEMEKKFILSTLTTLLKTTGNKSIYPRKTSNPPPYQPPPAKPQPIEHKPLPQAPALVIATSQGLGSSISHSLSIRSSPKRRSTSDKPQVPNRNAIQVQDYTFPSNSGMPMANLNTTTQISKGVGVNQEASLVTATSHNIDALHCLEMMQKNYKSTEEEHNKPVSKLLSSVGYGFPPLNQFGQQFKTMPPVAASRTVSASASDPSSADGSELSFELNNTQALPKYTEVSSYSTSNNGSTVKSESMPDILAGFDQMKKNETDAPIPEDLNFFAGAGIGESPCITSRSFDELHKFGAGLSGDKIHVMPHLDLNHHPGVNNKSQQPVANANSGLQHGIPTSVSGFSNVAFSQIPPQHQPNPNAAYYYRPTSTSNSSDLSTSDFD